MGKGYQKLFAKVYDPFMKGVEERLEKRRKALIAPLKGTILEVGSGTGINFKFYSELTSVLAIEPSKPMMARAQERLGDSSAKITLINCGINDQELLKHVPTGGFDAIVCTLVLCTVPNLTQTVAELIKLLAPTGQLIVLEHIHAKTQPKAFIQSAVNPVWKKLGEGCNLTRKTDEVLKHSGLKLIKEEYFGGVVNFYQAVFEKQSN